MKSIETLSFGVADDCSSFGVIDSFPLASAISSSSTGDNGGSANRCDTGLDDLGLGEPSEESSTKASKLPDRARS
ncbi:hypothetical protein FACS189472_07070 [Alphaproteobacteria bacterium]|nr:hypothetical protein FACS189472_07070 [Alphaproteobacteria bacterium]